MSQKFRTPSSSMEKTEINQRLLFLNNNISVVWQHPLNTLHMVSGNLNTIQHLTPFKRSAFYLGNALWQGNTFESFASAKRCLPDNDYALWQHNAIKKLF